MINDLQKYLHQFAHLNRAPGKVWCETTRRKAPHKPILLLAVMDLVSRGVIATPFIDVTGDLVELNELFSLYWRRIVPLGQSSSIAFPFSRLHNEPFWELVPQQGCEITPALINSTSSVSYLRKYALGAKVEGGLFAVMLSADGRSALRETLLKSCFSAEARASLEEQAAINAQAYNYSVELEKISHGPLVEKVLLQEDYRTVARDQGFRRVVVTTYDHRCALCGVRIITPEGHTVVDAAHIIPWSRSHNDDIRNGMALCKLCHWAFDKGMMGVADTYAVITSRQIGADPNVPGFLLTLSGRLIITPKDRELWPAQQYLSEHRKEWRL